MVVILSIIALVVLVYAIQAWWERKRRLAMGELAARLKLHFTPDKNLEIPFRYSFLDKLGQGDNRYAMNTIWGPFGGHDVMAFDYHYETHSTDSKGHRHTQHYAFSFFILTLPREFPELTIAREGWFSKIAQFLGHDDIDFESQEFSSAFCVRSFDKKFAYDVCNARMMEYLLANRDLTIEIEHKALALGFDRRLSVEDCETNLKRLTEIRARMPDYLMERT